MLSYIDKIREISIRLLKESQRGDGYWVPQGNGSDDE